MPLDRLIEWRARHIEDPIERLKYLRTATSAHGPLQRAYALRPRKWQLLGAGLLLVTMGISAYSLVSHEKQQTVFTLQATAAGGMQLTPKVWMVQSTKDYETYSNGLRIENRYTVANQPFVPYPVFARRDLKTIPVQWNTKPAGIVFHTTESHMVPFEPEETREILRSAGGVLGWTRKNKSYHYVIDRFGVVFRVVQESDIANHAGLSIWGDERYAYVNLNHSFLGVAFETQSQPGQDMPTATSAQIHSARVLTEMLRSKYEITARNCVTHAQVSVNPSNMLIGYHTDWAGNFPFSELGLGDNYVEPPASIDTFGFTYDSSFVNATGSRFWQGLILSEEQVRAQAVSQGLAPIQYRKILQQKYKEILAALKVNVALKENSDEN